MAQNGTPADTMSVELEGQPVAIRTGATVLQLLEQEGRLDPAGENPPAIASINGRRTSLAETLAKDDRVRIIPLADPLAYTTIQRTVQFLAMVAAQDLFGVPLKIDFSLGGGAYCELQRPEPMTAADVAAVEARMRELIARDLPLRPQRFGLRALIKIFERRGEPANALAAKYLRRESLVLYTMEGFAQLYYGRQLPSTGYVRAFALVPEGAGFVVMSGRKCRPTEVAAYLPQPKLLASLRQYAAWIEKMGLADTGSVNEYIVRGRTAEMIQIAEARHTRFFVEASTRVAELPEEGRVVLIAGPSSSGKTSSAKRLMVQLRVLGLVPFALSLDDYFVERERTPRGPDGDYDFEALGALRVDLFNEHLQKLLAGEPVHLPRFDFRTGRTSRAEFPTRLERGQPLIVEGIHALNPALTRAVPDADKLRIYVSALCHLNINNASYIKTTHSRLFRRIVRDAQFRGYTAGETLARWPKVRAGEDRHIFPHQGQADLFFNSGLIYELAVLKLWAEPRLAAVEPDDPNYGLARTLIDLLSLLLPVDASEVPPTSLLREFIGSSGFTY
jgi:uridine kinase